MLDFMKQHTYLVKELHTFKDFYPQIKDIKSGNIKVETSRDQSQFLLLRVLILSMLNCAANWYGISLQIYSMCIGDFSNYWPV